MQDSRRGGYLKVANWNKQGYLQHEYQAEMEKIEPNTQSAQVNIGDVKDYTYLQERWNSD